MGFSISKYNPHLKMNMRERFILSNLIKCQTPLWMGCPGLVFLLSMGCSEPEYGPPPAKPSSEYDEFFDRGLEEFHLKNYEKSKEITVELLHEYPENPYKWVVLQLLANNEYALEEYTSAGNLYREAAELTTGKEKIDLIYLQGVCLQLSGNFDEAHIIFDEVLDKSKVGSRIRDRAYWRLKLPKYFTIQVGAYRDFKNAEKQVMTLKNAGYTVNVETSRDAGGELYRIRVGRYSNRDEAKRAERKILESNILPPDARNSTFVLP